MNPYFQPNYPYNNPPPAYPFPNQPHYAPTPTMPQYPQPQPPSIESMYSNVQPYLTKEFLLSVFGSKTDYIRVFLTLPHEDKLKLYLLTEQKKFYGQISDRQGYQRILKTIAEKVQNYQNFYQPQQPKRENNQEKKEKELESKINLICEVSFQKLNVPVLGHQQPKQEKFQEDFGDFEEADEGESEQIVQSRMEGGQIESTSGSSANAWDMDGLMQNTKQNNSNTAPAGTQMYSMFTFDSEMERAMTKEIGLKKAGEEEKMSIWELELEESDLKTNQPNLKEVFKQKSDKKLPKTPTRSTREQYHEMGSASFNSNDLYHQPALNFTQDTGNNFSVFTQSSYSQGENSFKSHHLYSFGQTNPKDIPQANELFSERDYSHNIEPSHFNPPLAYQTATPTIAQISTSQIQTQEEKEDEEWEEAEQVQIVSTQPQTVALPNQLQQEIVAQIIEAQHPVIDVTPVLPNENLFDLDLIQTVTTAITPPAPINDEMTNLFFSSFSKPQDPSPLKQVHIDLQEPSFSEVTTTLHIQPPEQSSLINSQLFLPDNQSKYECLMRLQIVLPQREQEHLMKHIRNKSFECDTDFYLSVINYMRELQLEHSSQFAHFSEQYRIVKEMHSLTERYSHAVDEDEEEKVEASLRQSKQLYAKIYNNSHLTEQYLQTLLSNKSKERGVLYKLGRLLIDSCIQSQLLQRSINQQKKQIEQSFILLYILEKINALSRLKHNTEIIITHLLQQFERYRQLDNGQLQLIQQHSADRPKFDAYLRGLMRIAAICERMIQLVKLCCIKTNSNLVKTLKICKDLKSKYPHLAETDQTRFPPQYADCIRQAVIRNCSLYQLHSRFLEVVERNPSCGICLGEIQKWGGEKEQGGWAHYCCFNLLQRLRQEEQY